MEDNYIRKINRYFLVNSKVFGCLKNEMLFVIMDNSEIRTLEAGEILINKHGPVKEEFYCLLSGG